MAAAAAGWKYFKKYACALLRQCCCKFQSAMKQSAGVDRTTWFYAGVVHD